MNEASKRCLTCEKEKPLSEFHLNGKYYARQCVADTAPSTKQCRGCRKEKPLQDFYKSRAGQHGVMSRCKRCKGATGKYTRSIEPLPPTRKCGTCEQVKPLTEEFWYRHNKGGFRHECKACRGMYAVLKTYGVDREQFAQMLHEQDGGCAICGGTDFGKRSGYQLSVDHCHNTYRIRGLLCTTCNLAIGYLRDDPELCRRAAAYLERPLDNASLVPGDREVAA